MKKKINYFGWLIVLSLTFILYSCKDSMIAKEMDGTWATSYVTSYEDGTKSYIDEQITFKNDNKNEDGGSFIEIRTGKEEIDEDEVYGEYRWVSKIEGTWEISFEDLILHYNISTLEVEIGKEDVDYKIKSETILWNDLSSLIMGGLYLKTNLYKELKKEKYRQMFRYYKEAIDDTKNNGFTFPEVRIKGSVFSYYTSDMGRFEFHRIKEGQKLEQNKDQKAKADNSYIEEKQYSSSSEDECIDNNSNESSCSYQLSGFIDKYKIYMYLVIENNGNASGYYYYDSQGIENRIFFSGQYKQTDEGNQLTLTCNNQDIFEGYIEDSIYSGEFTNMSNTRLSFNMHNEN